MLKNWKMENQFGFPENGNGKLEKPNSNFQ